MGPCRRGAHRGRGLRLALFTPEPDAAWLRALRPYLEAGGALTVLDAPSAASVAADLHLHHLANDPRHGFVLQALRERPGVVLLEEWALDRLLLAETVGRGDRDAWFALARRAGGDSGAFAAALLARGETDPWLATRLPLAAVALDGALGAVACTADAFARLRATAPPFPVAHVPLPLVAAGGFAAGPHRPDRLVVAVLFPEEPRSRARIEAALAGLENARVDRVDLRRGDDAAAVLARAELLLALDAPSSGRIDPALGAALAAGVPVLVTAGTAAARELPEGVVARVSPGATEASELRGLVTRLRDDPGLRARMGALARAHGVHVGGPARAAASLLALARDAVSRAAARATATPPAGIAGSALDEARWVARDAGLTDAPPDVAALVAGLFSPPAR